MRELAAQLGYDAPVSQPSMIISPSLLSCDFTRIGAEVQRAEQAGADWLHVDVMDGHFVPNLTLGPPLVKAIHGAASVPLDVHLMITNPLAYAQAYGEAGAHVLTYHWEVAGSAAGAREIGAAFRQHGVQKVGVSVNPETPIEAIETILDDVDLVLVMSVSPGFGGQSFQAQTLDKTRWLRDAGYQGHVEMDGGVSSETLPACVEAGADALVSGSALFRATDMGETIRGWRSTASQVHSAAG